MTKGVDGWTAEKAAYDIGSNTCSVPMGQITACGHYTQNVWKETTKVGQSLRR